MCTRSSNLEMGWPLTCSEAKYLSIFNIVELQWSDCRHLIIMLLLWLLLIVLSLLHDVHGYYSYFYHFFHCYHSRTDISLNSLLTGSRNNAPVFTLGWNVPQSWPVIIFEQKLLHRICSVCQFGASDVFENDQSSGQFCICFVLWRCCRPMRVVGTHNCTMNSSIIIASYGVWQLGKRRGWLSISKFNIFSYFYGRKWCRKLAQYFARSVGHFFAADFKRLLILFIQSVILLQNFYHPLHTFNFKASAVCYCKFCPSMVPKWQFSVIISSHCIMQTTN